MALKALGEFIVRVAELAEAEGRSAKRHVVLVIVAALVWCAAMGFLVVGALGVSGAVFLGLHDFLHPGWALAFTAVLPLSAGVGCAVLGYFLVRRG